MKGLLRKKLLPVLLTVLLLVNLMPAGALPALAIIEGDFTGIGGYDTAGAGYESIGSLFRAPNGMYEQWDSVDGMSERALHMLDSAATVAVIEAEQNGTCGSFTFRDLGISAADYTRTVDLSLVFKDRNGVEIYSKSWPGSFTISSTEVCQLSDVTQRSYDIPGVSRIEIHSPDAGQLCLEDITYANVSTVNNALPAGLSLNNNKVPATAAVGTTVGTLSTSDTDVGDSFTYALVTGSGDTNNSLFNISGSSLQTAQTLSAGSYSIRVRTTDAAGATYENSFAITAFTVPDAPTIGTVTAGDGQASVSFTAPAFNGGSAITGYTVTSNPGGITASGTGAPITVTGLTNGTAYTFTVTAENAAGSSTASAASNSVTPKAAQTITFANPGAQTFGTTPTLFATASSGLPVTFSSSTTGVATITSDGKLTFVGTGTATIVASQAGNSAYLPAPDVTQSFTVSAVTPGAPTIGTATAGNGQATVSFTAPSSNGGAAITGYTVTSSSGGFTASGSGSPITVTGLTNGTAYTFTVTAENAAGSSTASAASNSVTPKAAQTITFANPGAQTFGTTPTLFATASSGLPVTFSSSTTGVATITSDGKLTFVGTGTATIVASQAGNSAYLPAPDVTQSFTVSAVTPGAPTIGTATAGNGQATVSFTAPSSNGGATITGYTVTSNPGGATGTGASSPITVTGLTNDVAYTFTVTATNAAGSGTASAASNSVTPGTAPVVSSVAVPANGLYGIGNTLSVTVNFDKIVTVNTSGGTPRIALTIGADTRYASYVSGSGTSTLVFAYTIAAGDGDTDGITIGSLGLNGGSIQDESGRNAVLTLNNVGSTANVKVDGVAPAIPILSLAAASDTGASSTDRVTNDNTPTFTGTAEANSTIRLFDGGVLLGTTTADGAGNWTFTVGTALSDGVHSISADCEDAAGNRSSSTGALTVTVDTVAPTLTLTPADGATGVPCSGNIVLAFDEPMDTGASSSVEFNGNGLTGGTWNAGATTYTLPYSGLGYLQTCSVQAFGYKDLAGNVVGSDYQEFTTQNETTPPTVTAVTPSGTSVALGTDELTVTFSEAMDTAHGTAALNHGASLANPVWSNGDKTISYDLSGLDYGTAYTLTLPGFTDVAGNALTTGGSLGFTTVVQRFALTVAAGDGGSVADADGDYVAGASVAIAATPDSGYVFDRWTTTGGGSFGDATAASTTFTMPAAAVTVTATFVRDIYVQDLYIVEDDDGVTVDLTQGSTILSVAQVNELIALNADRPVTLTGDGYTLTFPAGSLTAGSWTKDLDLGIDFNTGADYAAIRAKAGDDFVRMLDFHYSGALPGAVQLRLYAGTRYAGETLDYQRYNPKTDKFEVLQAVKVGKDGYVTVSQSNCSSYALTRQEATDDVPETGDHSSTLLWWLLCGASAVGMAVLVLWGRRRKHSN